MTVLRDLDEPKVPIHWWPAVSYVSCDGKTAVNTGPYYSPLDGTYGQFYTVWEKSEDGWRYRFDTGRELDEPMKLPAEPEVVKASCEEVTDHGSGDPPRPPHWDRGYSEDGSLGWQWFPKDGARELRVGVWDGKEYDMVITVDLPVKEAE